MAVDISQLVKAKLRKLQDTILGTREPIDVTSRYQNSTSPRVRAAYQASRPSFQQAQRSNSLRGFGSNFFDATVDTVRNAPTAVPDVTELPGVRQVGGYGRQQIARIKNPLLRGTANIAASATADIVNAPGNVLKGALATGANLADVGYGRDVSAQKALADLGTAGKGFAAAYTPARGASIARQGLKVPLKVAIKQGAKSGALTGGAYGLAQGLESRRNAETVRQQLTGAAKDTAIGIGAGGIIGGTAAGLSSAAASTVRGIFGKGKAKIVVKPKGSSLLKELQRDGVKRGATYTPATRSVSSLKLHEFDSGNVSRRTIDKYKQQMTANGKIDPIVITRAGEVLDGNHRIQAAKELGIKKLPVIIEQKKSAQTALEANPEAGFIKPGEIGKALLKPFRRQPKEVRQFESSPPSLAERTKQPTHYLKPDGTIDRTKLTGKQLGMTNEQLLRNTAIPGIRKGQQPRAGEIYPPTKEEAQGTIYRAIDDEMQNKGVKRWFNGVFNPIKNAPEDVQSTMTRWRNNVVTSRVQANEMARAFDNIPEEDGWKLIQYIQEPNQRTAERLNFDPGQYADEIPKIRAAFNEMRQQGIRGGLNIKYLDNYLNQVWKETPEQVNTIIKAGAGTQPGFVKPRTIDNYRTGMSLGLTPRFTHPAQLLAHYRYQLDKAFANKQMADELLASGKLLPANEAPVDWKPIVSPFFPKARIRLEADAVSEMDYKAPPDVAKAINNIFETREPGLMAAGAKLSKVVQEFVLSGGVPKTPINSFTLANLQKDVMAGRVRGPAVATAVSFSDKATKSYFKKNQDVLENMAKEGIRTFTPDDYTQMYKNVAESKTFRQLFMDGAKNTFDNWFNEPTFKRFMPVLQTEFFKDAYTKGVESGLPEEQARRVAADATKNFYGLADAFSRSGQVEDTLSTFIMAPRFREAMIGFWGKTLGSIKPGNLTDKAYSANRKFIAGAFMTYLMYQVANKQSTGRWMHENKPGKRLALEIPIGGGRSFFMPFLFTIGTVPRRALEAGSYLAAGDVAGAAERTGTFASIPVSGAAALLSNRTFYGGQIYKEDDPALTKLGKLGGYAVEQNTHPYIGNAIAIAQGRKSLKEAIPGFVEAPLYPSASSDTAHLRGKQLTEYKQLYSKSPEAAAAYSHQQKTKQDISAKIKVADKQVQAGVPTAKKPGFFARLLGGPKDATASAPLDANSDSVRAATYEQARTVIKSNLSDEEKTTALKDLGVESDSTTSGKVGTLYFWRDPKSGEFSSLDIKTLVDRTEPTSLTGKNKYEKETFSAVGKIMDSDLSEAQAKDALRALGVSEEDASYYQIAKEDTATRAVFAEELITGVSADKIVETLAPLRHKVAGSHILSNSVIDELYNNGLISSAQRKYLKTLEEDKATGKIVQKRGSGKKKKKAQFTLGKFGSTAPKIAAAKVVTGGRSARPQRLVQVRLPAANQGAAALPTGAPPTVEDYKRKLGVR